MTSQTIEEKADKISALLAVRLRVSGPTFESRVKRAKSRLPRPVRNAAADLVAAHRIAQIPKLRVQLDQDALSRAYTLCHTHLNGLNRAQRRKGAVLDAGARIAFAMLVVIVLWVSVLHWRGLV